MRSKMSTIGTTDSAFHDGNPSTGELGTIVTADWLNAVQASTMDLQDELLNVLAAASIANDPAVKTQILAAINKLSKLNMQSGSATFATDTGAANAYVVRLTPTLASPRGEGMVIRFKVANTNTGACTVNDGVSTVPIVGLALSALQGGEMAAGGDAWIQWHPSVGTGSYVLLLCSGSPSQIANGKKSQQAVAVNQLFGLLKGMQKITSSGSFTVPDNVTTIYVSGCAGGSGGGGSCSTSSGCSGGAGGGGAGESIIRQPFTVTPGQVINITIGAGGAGGAIGANGGAGGNTIVGSLVTLSGANYGYAGSPSSSSSSPGGIGGSGYPYGSYGSDAYTTSGGGGYGGAGASGPFGGGGGSVKANTGTASPGFSAYGYGSGGGGAGGVNGTTTSSGNTGGAGAPGLVIIEW